MGFQRLQECPSERKCHVMPKVGGMLWENKKNLDNHVVSYHIFNIYWIQGLKFVPTLV